MLVVGLCLRCVVCCPLFVVCCFLWVVCCLQRVVCFLLFVDSCSSPCVLSAIISCLFFRCSLIVGFGVLVVACGFSGSCLLIVLRCLVFDLLVVVVEC